MTYWELLCYVVSAVLCYTKVSIQKSHFELKSLTLQEKLMMDKMSPCGLFFLIMMFLTKIILKVDHLKNSELQIVLTCDKAFFFEGPPDRRLGLSKPSEENEIRSGYWEVKKMRVNLHSLIEEKSQILFQLSRGSKIKLNRSFPGYYYWHHILLNRSTKSRWIDFYSRFRLTVG